VTQQVMNRITDAGNKKIISNGRTVKTQLLFSKLSSEFPLLTLFKIAHFYQQLFSFVLRYL